MVFTESQHGTVHYLENFLVVSSSCGYISNGTDISGNLKYSTARSYIICFVKMTEIL